MPHDLRLPTDEQVEAFAQLIRAGNYVRTAADYAALNVRSVYNWMLEGQRDDGRQWCKDFYETVRQARAFAQAANLQIVQQAARNGQWQAAAWFLERSNPHEWGMRDRREVEITVDVRASDTRAQLAAAVTALALDLDDDEDDIARFGMEVLDIDVQPQGEVGAAPGDGADGATRAPDRRAG